MNMNINQALINVLSNPKTIIPDELAEYLFSNKPKWTFKTLLDNFNKQIVVGFAIDEAKLVLHVFEGKFPSDSRPRDAITAAEAWLSDHTANAADAADAAYAAASAAGDAAYASAAVYAVDVVSNAAYAASNAAYAADAADAAHAASAASDARWAHPSITLEDQIKRLFRLALNKRNSTRSASCLWRERC